MSQPQLHPQIFQSLKSASKYLSNGIWHDYMHIKSILAKIWHNYALLMQKLLNYAWSRQHFAQYTVLYHNKVTCKISNQMGLLFPRKSGMDMQTDRETNFEKNTKPWPSSPGKNAQIKQNYCKYSCGSFIFMILELKLTKGRKRLGCT